MALEIAVVGGGLAGLVAGLGLARLGAEVAVLDARPVGTGGQEDARTTAVLDPGIRFLREIGVWPRLTASAAPLARLRIVSQDGRSRVEADVTFAARELGLAAFGYNIPNGALHAALADALRRQPTAALHKGAALAELELQERHGVLRCADGRVWQADLVVAADGRDSLTRERAGIATIGGVTGQTAIVTRFLHRQPHHATSIELHRSGGPLTTVPLPHARRSSLVWVERDDQAEVLLAAPPDRFAAELERRIQPFLGEIEELAPLASFTVVNRRALRLTGPHLVLLGEAAHALSPLGAQGFNLSLRDAQTLAGLIAEARRAGLPPSAPAVLERYAQARAGDIRTRFLAVAALGRAVDSDAVPVRLARAVGLRLLDRIPGARRRLMRAMMEPLPDLFGRPRADPDLGWDAR